MDNPPDDHYAPVLRYVQAPEANRTPPADYKESFDLNHAQETAQSLMEYLISYSAEHGSGTVWARKDNEVTGVALSGAKLSISVFLRDAFDMDYSPAKDDVKPSEDGLVLMHIMPGFDRDHMIAWARHFVVASRFD